MIKENDRGNYDGLYHNTWDYTYIFDNKGNWIERNQSYIFIKPSDRDNFKLDFNNPYLKENTSYNSGTNSNFLSVNQIRSLIKENLDSKFKPI